MKKSPNDFSKQLYVTLTNRCNWKCWYCDFPEMNEEKCNVVSLCHQLDLLKTVPNDVEICLEGGEIGTVDITVLDTVFSSVPSRTYTVTTNGLFLEKGYHTRYNKNIHYILYHFAPELSFDTVINEYDFDDIQVDYTFVLHQDNLRQAERLLSKYVNHPFVIHLLQPRKADLGIDKTSIFYREVYGMIEDMPNVKKSFKDRVKKIIHNIDDKNYMKVKRNVCANIYNQPSINLETNMIHRCCISMSGDSVPFNKKNLDSIIKNKPTFPKEDSICDGCIAGFIWDSNKVKKMMRFVK